MNDEREIVIDLRDVWRVFVDHLGVIILAGLLAVGVFFAIIQLTFVPEYTSTATLYVLKQDDESTSQSNSDFDLSLKIINDCDVLLKSHAVLDQVISDMSLDMTYEELEETITTENPSNSRVLYVTVTAESPELAKMTADEICMVGQVKITEVMGFQQVNIVDKGTLDSEPSNRTGMKTYGLVGLGVMFLVYAIYLVRFLLDDTLRTDEDYEKYLGLTVLGNIPNANEKLKGKYGYYAYGVDTKKNTKKKTAKKRKSRG